MYTMSRMCSLDTMDTTQTLCIVFNICIVSKVYDDYSVYIVYIVRISNNVRDVHVYIASKAPPSAAEDSGVYILQPISILYSCNVCFILRSRMYNSTKARLFVELLCMEWYGGLAV